MLMLKDQIDVLIQFSRNSTQNLGMTSSEILPNISTVFIGFENFKQVAKSPLVIIIARGYRPINKYRGKREIFYWCI